MPFYLPGSLDPWVGALRTGLWILEFRLRHGHLLDLGYLSLFVLMYYVPLKGLGLLEENIYRDISLSDYLYGGEYRYIRDLETLGDWEILDMLG